MTKEEILTELLSDTEYDTSVGSVFFDIMSPIAEALKERIDAEEALENAIDINTAEGEYLNRKAAEQGLERKAGTYSSGMLRIYGEKGAVISAGAKTASSDLLFSVLENAVIGDSGFADVTAVCMTVGAAGNVKKGEIYRFPVTLPELTGVSNITDFSGGADEETDESLRQRYFDKVSNPSGFGTLSWYENTAMEVSGVGKAKAVATPNGPGTVKLMIADSDIEPAEEELVSKVISYMSNYSIPGALLEVVSFEKTEITVTAKLDIDDSITTISAAAETIKIKIKEYLKNAEYISNARLRHVIMSIPGVNDYSGFKLNNSVSDNVSLKENSIAVLKEVSIE